MPISGLKRSGNPAILARLLSAIKWLNFSVQQSLFANVQLIPDQITVTIILGGFPVVNEVTKKPDSVSEQLVEYSFEYSFK
jgi:hypothetical protein